MFSFLVDFYSFFYFYSFYRYIEYYFYNEQIFKYFCRDMYRESENIFFFFYKYQEKVYVNYLAFLYFLDKKSVVAEVFIDDQLTDLSFFKNSYKFIGKVLGLVYLVLGFQESKGIFQFQVISSQSRDCYFKVCRVSFMIMSVFKKYFELFSRSGKFYYVRLENFRKMEGMVYFILYRKMSFQNIGVARLIKRSLEDLDFVIVGKKVRVVFFLDVFKDVFGKEKVFE